MSNYTGRYAALNTNSCLAFIFAGLSIAAALGMAQTAMGAPGFGKIDMLGGPVMTNRANIYFI